MERKLIGRVTQEEKDEIQKLYERRNGLNELARVLTVENDSLYEKLLKDMAETASKFQLWWDTMATNYNWEIVENGNWEINFESCDIYLCY